MSAMKTAGIGTEIRGMVIAGLAVIAAGFGGVGTWAAITPLASAAIAPGKVSPDGASRTISHLEGGIVSEIRVREGDVVEKGAPLLVLDEALARADQRSQFRKLARLEVLRARLTAEAQGAEIFVPPIDEDAGVDQAFLEYVANERETFALRRERRAEQLEIYDRQLAQVVEEIRSMALQAAGLDEQVVLLESELKTKQALFDQGLLRESEVNALARKRAELSSEAEALRASMARASMKSEEIEISKTALDTELLNEVSERLAEVNAEVAQVEEALNATSDILSRTEILSPIDGTVLTLNAKTVGGVVRPGEPILTLTPFDEDLIVEARLDPRDVDNVMPGMSASVQFPSFLMRHALPMEGVVLTVGSDAIEDEASGTDYYPLRVKVSDEDIAAAIGGAEIRAGMPADVFVETGHHTPLRYAFDPILASFSKAFREEVVR
ncbi:HlyD family secretion protein/epimerase transport system membrane fusion protein [Limimaricola soesokkakensis]|uniref:Membrane fusion protein (MFP) family protein n=1 Tax=Limimaricola soesokkakensis TaxID=1343159 RepID=A0A1X7A577_9RHOB|nr:HlyD family type I secretion periplasmic adaptor subunit [Limimaricola soesokkakensis]PSK81382.1 HlyD family secretion protein/epimerase transport system membrane fusion protein [Limimaricola soesokkakensis]SLN70450.1 Type I secretion system membrane fusion protein PrsE [Limimaricola soesokkakensis]